MSSTDAIGTPDENFGLRHVGGQHPCVRKQLAFDGLDRVFVEQPIATLGDHDRVDDHGRQVELDDRRGDRLDDRPVGQHADLDGAEIEVPRNCLDLSRDQVCRHRQPGRDPERVLRRDRCNGGRSVHAVRCERLEVGLNAGATARVAARNCQCCAHTVRFDRYDGPSGSD